MRTAELKYSRQESRGSAGGAISPKAPAYSAGFTLIELLTVIVVICILAAILFPGVTAARRSANRAKTKVQFNQWAAATEAFRSEYGYYPVFDSSNLVNGGAASMPNTLHLFHDILVGKRRDGSALPAYSASAPQAPEAQNRKLIAFHSFADSDFMATDSGTPHLLRDASDNTAIAVLVDRNLDGFINTTDYPAGFPLVSGIRPSVSDIPASGIRAGVAFYAPAPGATTANPDFVCSWK